jgi:hypothetical protein
VKFDHVKSKMRHSGVGSNLALARSQQTALDISSGLANRFAGIAGNILSRNVSPARPRIPNPCTLFPVGRN